MRNRNLRLGLVLLSGAAVCVGVMALGTNTFSLTSTAHAEEKQASGAEAFIQNLTDKGVAFLSDSSLSVEQQKQEFKTILNRDFDLNTIGRFALGRYWKSANKEQRDEYLKLFNTMVIDVYSQRFEDYNGQDIKITGSRPEGKKDVLVSSVMKQKGGPDVRLDWRVREKNGGFKVVDVIVEGVSMSLTQRSDFASVIQRGGGNVEALLQHLRS
ncbi:MAG: ABC transporter substrate-binding protein [Alphaproteobacteria bacterium]|nr:ABC transporter substrate-binding protein [Alphaproteobacteria bacterium]